MSRNPIILFRDRYNLSQQELAEQASVTYRVVRDAELGMFNNLPPSLEAVIEQFEGRDRARRVRLDYEDWLENHISVTLKQLPSVGSVRNFIDWRFKIGRTTNEFCRKMRLQHTIVNNYENGKTKNLPQLIEKRLRKIGANNEYIAWVRALPVHA